MELSGVFASPEKWAAAWQELASPGTQQQQAWRARACPLLPLSALPFYAASDHAGCTIAALRIHHQSDEQLAATARALASNSSVTRCAVRGLSVLCAPTNRHCN